MRALAIVATLAACSVRPAPCTIAPPATHGPAFLWRVQRERGPIVWLYGTIHDAGLEAVPPAALAAFATATRFASELGDDVPDPDVVREMLRQPGQGIDQLLPRDDWWELRDALLDVIKEDDLRRVKPWYAMSLLTSHSGRAPAPSMDDELAKRARTREIAVEHLETWQVQMSALDAVVTIADLQEAIHARREMRCVRSAMRAVYDAGDDAGMQRLLVTDRTAKTMLWDRNARWLPEIEAYLAGDGAFVAVGLGHLLGDHGLPALLARDGYTVERVGPSGR